MHIKSILTMIVILSLSTSTLFAKDTHLDSLVNKQQTLTKKIAQAYKTKAKKAHILSTVKDLEEGQKKLKKMAIHNSEINNLFVFLNICLKDMKILIQKPYSRENAQKVADLGASISEGSRYIAKS